MKKIFFTLALMLSGSFVFASNADTSNFAINYEKTIFQQDCNEYAANAADQEVGFWENFLTEGQAYMNSYNYWQGYCEGASAGGATVLDPVFID
ncbi:hypothetical protein [Psychroserpens luteus]|uniref:Uncharacterized protein n=1 Tax=Psychroserpens luteus TaxID=1434066 RepID=A0ABW5ZYZ1_9FLAO|nr:hypothetical protein [Psychroserpens luteus]